MKSHCLLLSSSSGRKQTHANSIDCGRQKKLNHDPFRALMNVITSLSFLLSAPQRDHTPPLLPSRLPSLLLAPFPPTALYNGPDRQHLQQFSRALKILLLPQAFVPRRRLALKIAAPTPIAAICSKRRRILPPTPRCPCLHLHLPPPLTLLTPLIPPPVNNWLMADEMGPIAAGGALTCYKSWTPDTGCPPPPSNPKSPT